MTYSARIEVPALYTGALKGGNGKRGTMKNTGVENAGPENVGPNRISVHFSLFKIWHLVATILIMFLRINWPNLVQYCSLV